MNKKQRRDLAIRRRTLVLARRALIAELRLKFNYSIREIQAAMRKSPDVPGAQSMRGKAWTIRTIHMDIQALEAEWKQRAEASTDEHRRRILAEIEQVKESAWKDRDRQAILAAIKQEREMLGIDAPQKIAPTNPDGTREFGKELTDSERTAGIVALLESARARKARLALEGEAALGTLTGSPN